MAVWDCAEGVWGVVGVFGFGVWVVSLDLVFNRVRVDGGYRNAGYGWDWVDGLMGMGSDKRVGRE